MPKKIEGFLDNGRGAPLADIPVTATILGDGAVADTTITDADGHWLFTDLSPYEEHLVTLTDTAGNAVSRAPWSGEMRELWVRDRLDVLGKPVVLDPAAGNSLAWSATGLYVPPVPTVDLTAYYTKTEADALYLTSAEADALFLTPAEGNAAYATSAHNHDTTYVQLTGGSVLTGLLGPSTHNTRDLGTTGTRWRALYGMTADLTTSLTVATKPLVISPDASNIVEWRANGLYAAAGAVSDIWVNTGGDTMTGDLLMTANVLPTVTNTRDLGSTTLWWRKVWANDAYFNNTPTIGASSALTVASGDATYVKLAGSTMTGDLTMTANVLPTVTNVRSLGSTSLRWLKVWAVNSDLSGALTVAGPTIALAATVMAWGGTRRAIQVGAAGALTSDTAVSYLDISENTYHDGTNVRAIATAPASRVRVLAGVIQLATAPSVAADAVQTFTDRLTIDTAGVITTTNVLNITVPANTALRLRGGGANDNVQLRFMGNTTAVDQWAIGNEVSTGTVGRNFDIYDLVAGANRLRISSTGGVTIPGTLTAGQTGISSGLTVSGGINVTTGGGTISPTLYVNSRQVIMAGCRVYHNVSQTITTGTPTALAFNSERYDTDNFHDTVTNNTRLTVPAGHAGKYLIWAVIDWVGVADATWRNLVLKLNGTTDIGRVGQANTNSTSFPSSQCVTITWDLAAGDYLQCFVRHERGSNLDLYYGGGTSPEFGMTRVG